MTKWIPWIIQIFVLVWGASKISATVDLLSTEVVTLRATVSGLQIRVAELTVEIDNLKRR